MINLTGLHYQTGFQQERHLPPSIIEVAENVATKQKTDADVTKTFLNQVAVTHEQISKIEEASRGQPDSEVWI